METELNKIPCIEEAACIAVPDPEGVLGEVVKACLVKKSSEPEMSFAEIASLLTGKIESYKMPAIYEWIEAIPKTSNGKIQRGLLK